MVSEPKKIKTSIAFDEALWKEFRKKCIDLNRKYADVLEELMKGWLKR